MKNRLAEESSPYLLQHADNPVDWFPWGEEAFQLARERNKPILLSVGYAACHWCHVMAHESFEDPDTGAFMNEHFVNVKVDREERPDVDRIYMNAVVAMTGQGGWPMTVALTPEGEPFFGGTYFPPLPRHGLPSFRQLLASLADAWSNRHDQVKYSASEIAKHLEKSNAIASASATLSDKTLSEAANLLARQFDDQFGGFGQAPKFPQPMILEFLLRYHSLTDDTLSLSMVEKTLDMMAKGGIHDHLGGGFARYSTDRYWLVPHFEKMLYDNALLARSYVHAWQVSKRPFYRTVAESTLDWILDEMTGEEGGFYCSLDADSEGVEGKYYLWDINEIRQLLGSDAEDFIEYYGVTEQGNWEGKNILNGPQLRDAKSTDLERVVEVISSSKEKLLEARSQRVRPGLDDKILTSWNGLALSALAEAARVLGSERYRDAAVRNAEFLHRTMRLPDGRLLRTWRSGHEAKIAGFLEDYAFLADGLLRLYECTFDERWFSWCQELVEIIIEMFANSGGTGFFDTASDHEKLINRPRETQDNAIPSGNAVAVDLMLRLYLYTGIGLYWDAATEAVEAMQDLVSRYPMGFGQWLGAAAFALANPVELALIGKSDSPPAQMFLDYWTSEYRPFAVVAAGQENSRIPLLAGKPQIDDSITAYLCQDFVCRQPVTSVSELNKLWDSVRSARFNE